MRKEFIPNWTNDEFIKFVNTLEGIVNDGVKKAVNDDRTKWDEVVSRAEPIWKALLDAEEAFWPDL